MTQLNLGYWDWEPADGAMRRSDGCALVYAGNDPSRPHGATRAWLRFRARFGDGEIELPVEQRFEGRDGNLKALWYRVDLRALDLDPDRLRAVEALAADALLCWPRGDLSDGRPAGVAFEGGYLNGRFRPDVYRLHQAQLNALMARQGRVSAFPSAREWTYQPPDPSVPEPSLDGLGPYGSAAMHRAVAQLQRRHPTLRSGDSSITLFPAKHARIGALVVDGDYVSDVFRFAATSRNHETHWKQAPGSRRLPAQTLPPATFQDAVRDLFVTSGSRKNPVREKTWPEQTRRALSGFHEAFFALPAGGIETTNLRSPPVLVRSKAWFEYAGAHLHDITTATELATRELRWALCDEREEPALAASTSGAWFDQRTATLTGPDGSTLELVKVEHARGIEPMRILMRCRSAGLDWPVVVEPLRREPTNGPPGLRPTLSQWQVDHARCLNLWQAEGHVGLPEEARWDCLRQFIEDALLSWPDCPQTGPAPVSIALRGGWYEGEWHGLRLTRLLSAPRLDLKRAGSVVPWLPYAASPRWIAQGEERAVEKHRADDERVRFYDAGYTETIEYRDGTTQRNYFVEYAEPGFVLRFSGTAKAMSGSGAIVDGVQGEASVEPPEGLARWRAVRDALEGGLREWEWVEMRGGYIFDRFHSDIKRRAGLETTPDDFGMHPNI